MGYAMERVKSRRAIIVGGSLGGLFAANLLRKIGWEVHVFESAGKELASRGAGIATHQELLTVVNGLGITIDESIGIRVRSKLCYDSEGNMVHQVPADRIMSAWSRFYRPMRELIPDTHYRFAMPATGFKQDADGVTVFFQNGEEMSADLLIAADGLRSTIRQQLMPYVQPHYAGYVAWRGQVDEKELPEALHRELFDYQTFCLPEGEMMITNPMPGANDDVRPGFRRYNFVWYHPVDGDRGLPDLCTDAMGHCHGTSIAHALIRPDVIENIKDVAHRILAPQIAKAFCLSPRFFFQPIFDLESPRLVEGRVVLLGDAAFVVRPHVGMGVAKAALDAQCLADALVVHKNDWVRALGQYEQARLTFGQRAVARGRWLGAHLEAQNKPRSMRTKEELHQYPEVVAREVGKQIKEIPELAELVQ